ncbi:hypothetical protein [Roseateles noduli]|uniref:hypothetical protein n=1 Tax=Roseateles noduli TaxID=2052484 RepID=UPI003D64B962
MTETNATSRIAARNSLDTAFQALARGAEQDQSRARSILGKTHIEGGQHEQTTSVSKILAGAKQDGRQVSRALAAAMNACKAANTALWALAYGTSPAVLIARGEGHGPTAQDCNAALIDFDEPWPLDDGDLQPGDRRALISPEEGLQPGAGMSLNLGGATWQIVRSRRLAPAGAPLLFLCQVRP